MRNSKLKSLLYLCAYLSSWLLCGIEAKCEILEFPGAENHRFIAQQKTWLNFSFQVKDEECISSKLTEIRVYREFQPLCHLKTENGSCTVFSGSVCGCSEYSLQFTFSKMTEDNDAKEWRWTVRHDQTTIDECVVTFSLNLTQELKDRRDNSSFNCMNRLPITRSIITSTSLPDQDSPIEIRSSSENVTAVLGETRRVDFLVQTRASQITNCTLSKIFQGTGDGRDSAVSPANHTCTVKWEMQGKDDQIGGKNRPTGPTGSKCLCSFRPGKSSNVLLTVFLFDSRVNDSGRWSVKVNNSHSRGQAEFALVVTDNTYAVREPEKWSSVSIVPILLAAVAGLMVVGMVSFMCWRCKIKPVFQEPDYSSTPIVNNSLAIRKLPITTSTSSITSLSNQTQSSRLLRISRDQTKNRQTEDQVQVTNAPTNAACEVNCSNEPVTLDTGVKTSCSAVDMKLVLYIKGCPVNPEIPHIVSPTSVGLEYLNPCSPMYATMDPVEKINLPGTYQNDIGGDMYMAMSPPRYCSMPRSMIENAGVSEDISSDPRKKSFYSNFEENSNTKILHLNCENSYDRKLAEASEYDKKLAEASEYSVIS